MTAHAGVYALGGATPEIAADAWIAPGAHVIGRVKLGAGASVWFGAALRGDNEPIEIGPGSNIQENAVLHTDPGFPLQVGRHVTIGHGAIVHGCTVADGALIGMGAIVLNGAQIAEGCLVGAGALVTEGKRFEPGSLIVGSPARSIRNLDAASREAIIETARRYVANADRFRRETTCCNP